MKKSLIKALIVLSSLNITNLFGLSSCWDISLYSPPLFYNIDTTSLFAPKYILDRDYSRNLKVYNFPDTPINFVKVKDFVNVFLKLKETDSPIFSFTDYSCFDNGQQTVIINDYNQAKVTIDCINQTISFDDYDKFNIIYADDILKNNPLAAGYMGGKKLLKISELNYTGHHEVKINCSDYNIPMIRHNQEDYLPWEIINNIVSPVNFPYYFNGNDFYQCPSSSNYTKDAQMVFLNFMKQGMISPTQEYLNYCYNSLAMCLDYKWGLKTRQSRINENDTIKYFPNGAYDALKNYKDKMVSLTPNIANQAMLDFYREQMDDGGHSVYNGINILCNKTDDERNLGLETKNTTNTVNELNRSRMNDGKDHWQLIPNKTIKDKDSIQASVEIYDNIRDSNNNNNVVIYMAFDGFDDTNMNEAANTKYSDVNKTNYYKTSVGLIMYTDSLIRSYKKQSNKKINLVVDLSCNVGGQVWIEHFIASWLCGSVKEKINNPVSGGLGEYTIQADVNTDGVFNENDYLPNDVNVFCIISNATFSCGNLLSCNLKDQLKNVKFIGDWTGGGSCYVGNINLGLANLGNISSTYHAQNINNEDAENGVRADYLKYDKNNIAINIYKREELNKKIVN